MPQPRQSENSISFQVADVQIGEECLPETSTLEALGQNAQARIVSCSNPEQALVDEADFSH